MSGNVVKPRVVIRRCIEHENVRWNAQIVRSDFVESSEFINIPTALRPKHMTGGSGILYGIK